MIAREFRRRRREVHAAQKRERLLVERGHAGAAFDAAVDHAPFPVEVEDDVGDALFTAGPG